MPDPDELYRNAIESFGGPLRRLVSAYELDRDRQRDLEQEIHLALWRSFRQYEARCSLRTWVYRVAHNTAASWVVRQKRLRRERLSSLDELTGVSDAGDHERRAAEQLTLDRLFGLIRRLKPPDRQVMLLYLEGIDAASIGEITGVSEPNVRTKVRRLKRILAERFHEGGRDD